LPRTKIQAILFDLGETLVNFGKIESAAKLFKDAGRRSYTYLKKLNQPVDFVQVRRDPEQALRIEQSVFFHRV